MGALAQKYNVPQPILEAMNPHIQNPETLAPGSITYIPRLYKMNCHKMYLEHGAAENEANSPMNQAQKPTPYADPSYPMYQGQQMTP
ncbi:hypothetical protein D3C73_764100 [compost metagenome]